MIRQQVRKLKRLIEARAERNLARLMTEKEYRWNEIIRIKREYDALPVADQIALKAKLAKQIDQHLAVITG